MTATATNQITTADVVTGRPVFAGKAGNRRKGIVLGDHAEGWVIVWWYGMGDAKIGTSVCIMQRSELKKVGDIFDTFRARKAASLARGLYHFNGGQTVGWSLTRHAARMKSIGVL